jgi:hypothetical protein
MRSSFLRQGRRDCRSKPHFSSLRRHLQPERTTISGNPDFFPVRCTAMKTGDSVTLLDQYVMAALPTTMLNINNGDIPHAVTDAFETGLELVRRRDEYHRRAAELSTVLAPGGETGGAAH